MRFTVVVPLFDKGRYVREAIDSVLAQSCTDWELVVVDDGSTDGSGDVVARIHDPRVRLLRQRNTGVSAARNAGIEHADGKWVTFLDADDWYHPKYLSVLSDLSDRNPDVDAVATGFASESEDAWSPWAWPIGESAGHRERIVDLPRRWMRRAPLYTNSLCIRASRLKRMQPCFPVGESSGEDLDLIFRVAEQGDIVLDHRPLVAYRRGAANSLSRAATEGRPSLEPYLLRMEQRARSRQLPKDRSKSAQWFVDQQRITLARTLLAAGDRLRAARLLLDARRAADGHRWWVTLAMSLLMTAEQVGTRERRARETRMAAEAPPDAADFGGPARHSGR